MSGPARRLSRHTAANTAHGGILTMVTVVINGILFRHLGVDFGPFTLVWASTNRFDFFEDSLGSFIIRSVAGLRSPDEGLGTEQDRMKDIGAATALYVLLAMVSAVILFVALRLVLDGQTWAAQGAALGSFGLATVMVGRPASKALEGEESYVGLRAVQSGAAVFSLGVVGLLIAVGAGSVVNLLAVIVAIQVVTTLTTVLLLSRILPLQSLLPPADAIHRWPHILRFMRPLVLAKGSAVASYRLDLWIVQVLVGPVGTSLYAVGETIASLAAQTIEVFKATLPVSVRDAFRGRAWLRRFTLGTTKITASAVGLVAVFLIVNTGPIMQIWFGSVSSTSVWVARVLLVFYALTAFRSPMQTILVGRDRFHRLERWFVSAGAVNVTASLILTLYWGTLGPALGTLIAGALLMVTNIMISEAELGMERWSMFREVLIPGLLSLSIACAVGLALPSLSSPIATIGLGGAVSGGLFLLAAWWSLLSPSDRALLGSWIGNRNER